MQQVIGSGRIARSRFEGITHQVMQLTWTSPQMVASLPREIVLGLYAFGTGRHARCITRSKQAQTVLSRVCGGIRKRLHELRQRGRRVLSSIGTRRSIATSPFHPKNIRSLAHDSAARHIFPPVNSSPSLLILSSPTSLFSCRSALGNGC